MIRVAVVENQVFVRECLAYFIEKNEIFEVVLQAESGDHLFIGLKNVEVDLVLLNMVLPKMDGDETCQRLINYFPKVKIMIYSSFHNLEKLSRVMGLGVHGYLPGKTNAFQFNQAIFNLHNHGYYYGDELSGFIKQVIQINKEQESSEIVSPYEIFSEREIEIIRCVFLQLSTTEIAKKLHISKTTVETHRARIIKKTKSRNFIGVLLYVVKHDLYPLNKFWVLFFINVDCRLII